MQALSQYREEDLISRVQLVADHILCLRPSAPFPKPDQQVSSREDVDEPASYVCMSCFHADLRQYDHDPENCTERDRHIRHAYADHGDSDLQVTFARAKGYDWKPIPGKGWVCFSCLVPCPHDRGGPCRHKQIVVHSLFFAYVRFHSLLFKHFPEAPRSFKEYWLWLMQPAGDHPRMRWAHRVFLRAFYYRDSDLLQVTSADDDDQDLINFVVEASERVADGRAEFCLDCFHRSRFERERGHPTRTCTIGEFPLHRHLFKDLESEQPLLYAHAEGLVWHGGESTICTDCLIDHKPEPCTYRDIVKPMLFYAYARFNDKLAKDFPRAPKGFAKYWEWLQEPGADDSRVLMAHWVLQKCITYRDDLPNTDPASLVTMRA